jgi:hypothetical protein
MNDKLAWNIRSWIYSVGICALMISCIMGSLKATEALWPPDMVPHPTPPWEQTDEEEPELS